MYQDQERKLAAIMFTDMVGYSALTQRDENLALELLEEHRQILRPLFPKHNGREIETAGDAFFVEFTSALEAVKCAINIQMTLWERNKKVPDDKQINIRIGIHLGDVVHKGENVLGDGVNIAARIEPLAQACGICISEDVARQVQNKIDLPLKNLGKEELKNIHLPVNIFKVILPWEKLPKQTMKKQIFTGKVKTFHVFLVTMVIIFIILIYFSDRIASNIQLFSEESIFDANQKRIAVLPFDNFSPDQKNIYIADGFTEEIITVLSRIKGLQVIARTSVMKYKEDKKNIAEIAEELNIGIALEGSVRKEKDRIRVTAQLIDARTQEHLWAESYDKKFDHIFDLQDDIAFKIAKALQITLVDIEKEKIEKRSTQNIKAYNAYLQGRYYWNMRTAENLVKGMNYFQLAIEADSNFALAYTGIADSYHLLCSYGVLHPKVGFPKAKKAALKAIEIDGSLAEGYNALAAINLVFGWDWSSCERDFRKSLELNPSNVQTYSWYAMYFQINKKFNRAFALVKEAINLDPLSAIARTDLGQINYHAGNFEQAILEYQKSLELDSNYVYTYAYLGQALVMNGQTAEAEEAFKRAVYLTGERDPATLSGLAYVYARQGKTDLAKSIISQLTASGNEFYVHPMYISIIYGALGEIDQAFYWLERGIDDRSEWMVYLQVEHMLQPLKRKERFKKLVQKMNFR